MPPSPAGNAAMMPPRLSAKALAEHLLLEPTAAARTVRALRAVVLHTAPEVAEAIRFGVLCYYRADAFFKSIGGNVCMIEIKDVPPARRRTEPAATRQVRLAFIHGASLPDPHGLLRGTAKAKRFVPIPDAAAASRPEVAALLRAARDLRPEGWE